MYELLKSIARRYMPRSLLQALKIWHYRRVFWSFDEVEEPDLKVVRKLVVPGATVVDLGANIGVYTRVLSELVGPKGRVISVEPVPDTFETLRRNVQSLKTANVTLVNAAVSDKPGTVTMAIPSWKSGGGNFYQAQVVAGQSSDTHRNGVTNVVVSAAPLDSVVNRVSGVSFVKCDVEGHEEACLAGAERLLHDEHPAWLIEVWSNPDLSGTSASRVFGVFGSHGYSPWVFDGANLIRRTPGKTSMNFFFLTDEQALQLRQRHPELFGRE